MKIQVLLTKICFVLLFAIAFNISWISAQSSASCPSLTSIRIGYIPNSRALTGDNGYTIDGFRMTAGAVPKLQNSSYFGANGVVKTSIIFVPLYGTITESVIAAANVQAIFIGGIDNAVMPFLSDAETNAIKNWSSRAGNTVLVTNITANRWGWRCTNNNINPDRPTQKGFSTPIFNGPFGVVPQFNQGGSLQCTMYGGAGDVLGVDGGGRAIFVKESNYNDIVVADVDIFTDLGGISGGSTINNNNDKLLCNIFAYLIQQVSCPSYVAPAPAMCASLPGVVRVGYIPNSRDRDGDNGYTFDGGTMSSSSFLKLVNAANFGQNGTVRTTLQFVPLTGTITASTIQNANVNIIFIGGIDNATCGVTGGSYLSSQELLAIKNWSVANSQNLVIASQASASAWGWTATHGTINPNIPTAAGLQTVIFNGPFGVVPQYNQGGCYNGMLSGGTGTVLGVDAANRAAFVIDKNTQDLIVGDVDIFTCLGGVSNGGTITNNNDRLLCNLFAYAINLVTCPTCQAGSTAPTVSSTAIGNTCPSTTVNLGNLITNTIPTNTRLVWYTNADRSGNPVAMPVTTAGTYYAFFYDAANNCYSPASAGVTVSFTSCVDTDGDGVPDNVDLDDDNDGILDIVENGQISADTDGDGVPNRLDLDSDNDGINDVIEANGSDVDRDGIADGKVGTTGIPASAGTGLKLVDTDGDGRNNPYDLDSDNDGINDIVESGNSLLVDNNGDGLVDGTDPDGDGILGSADGNPNNRGDMNDPVVANTDKTGEPNYLDLDSDGDGLTDLAESGIENAAALDTNKDGKIDNANDPDGDGIAQVVDGAPSVFGDANNPTLPDVDKDGQPDYVDINVLSADLFPNYTFSNTTFKAGESRDIIININEIKGNPTTGQIQFFVPFSAGFTYTFSPSQSTASVLSTQAVNNAAWTVTTTTGGLIFTTNQVIPANGKSCIALNIKADVKGTDANITTNITPLSGGEVNGLNNTAVLGQSIQN